MSVWAPTHSLGNSPATDVYLSNTTLSFIGIQSHYPAKPDGDNQKFYRCAESAVDIQRKQPDPDCPVHVSATGITFNVSQARAPPQ
ncbi:MAG: hypothetical protein KDI33_13435 [Halioglobus sp.]|nr:hypothetical protein [Halioglobus sp.]